MKLTEPERIFIVINHQIITGLLDKRVIELQDSIITCREDERNAKIESAREVRQAIASVKELVRLNNQPKKDTAPRGV